MLSEKEKQETSEKLQECLDHLERLNDWEKHFIENNSEFFEEHKVLSSRQLEVLDQIHRKIA